MTPCRLGTTIIDELRLCYVTGPVLFEILGSLNLSERIEFSEFYMIRVGNRYFRHAFHLCCDMENGRRQFATLHFGRYGDDKSPYVWYRPDNWVLYDEQALKYAMTIPTQLGLCFHNITALDLAKDFRRSVTNLIRRLYRDKSVTTIVNGKAVRDRNRILPELHIAYEVSLDRLRNPTFYAKQRKALHDKTKGVCVCAYNKRAEIEDASDKEYIMDFYGHPQTLHRLEVHLNAAEIRDYCHARRIAQYPELIFDEEFLTELFCYHLSSVIRFTKGRRRLDWKELLGMQS